MKLNFWKQSRREPVFAFHINGEGDCNETTELKNSPPVPSPADFYLLNNKRPLPKSFKTNTDPTSPEWNELLIFAVEPRLAALAVKVSGSRTLWQLERESVFKAAMKEADTLIGENAADPRLRHQAAWDFFNNYLFDLLRL